MAGRLDIMKLNQTYKLTQNLVLTPYMRQSLYILQLPIMDLKKYLEAQIEENPVLTSEERDDQEGFLKEQIEKYAEYNKEEFNLSSDYHLDSDEINKKRDYIESLITKPVTLEEHLLQQLRMQNSDDKTYKIGEFIVTNLDSDGYLNLSLEEIMNHLNNQNSLEIKVTKKDIEDVLKLIHTFEPEGVGARDLKECLLIQLKLRDREKSPAYKIVKNYLHELAKNKIKFIAKKLKIPVSEVITAREEVSYLDPRPVGAFDYSIVQKVTRNLPDIVLEKIGGKYEIIVNSRWLPKLKINPYYLKLFKSEKISPETKIYIQEKVKASLGIMKAISQREETIRKIARCIVDIQKDFFESEDRSLLKPLTLKAVAEMVDRNESTISRVVNNKYMKTSFGLFKLDYFFTTALKSAKGEKISQEYVKYQMLNIVEEEDRLNILKDSDIAEILKNQGIIIARRTVAKYREDLNIPSYHCRKRRHRLQIYPGPVLQSPNTGMKSKNILRSVSV